MHTYADIYSAAVTGNLHPSARQHALSEPLTRSARPFQRAYGRPTRKYPAYTPADSHLSNQGTYPKHNDQALPHNTEAPLKSHSHSDQLATISRNPRPLPHNLARPNQILQHLLVHSSESARSRSFLLVGKRSVSFWFGKDSTLGEEDDVFVGELLLKLAGKPGGRSERGRKSVASGMK